MANYPPPTENLPIFDPSVFEVNNIPLTIGEGSKYFLTYPTAQGKETLSAIDVYGIANFYSDISVNNTTFAITTTNLTTSTYFTEFGGYSININPLNCYFGGLNPPSITNAPALGSDNGYIPTTEWVNSTIGLTRITTLSNTFSAGLNPTIAYANLFNSTYTNYRINLNLTCVNNAQFTQLQISAFSGTGTIPTTYTTQASSVFNGSLTQIFTSVLPINLSGATNQNKSYTIEISGVGTTAGNDGFFMQVECMKNSYSNSGGGGNWSVFSQAFVVGGATPGKITGLTLRLFNAASQTYSTDCIMTIYGYNI